MIAPTSASRCRGDRPLAGPGWDGIAQRLVERPHMVGHSRLHRWRPLQPHAAAAGAQAQTPVGPTETEDDGLRRATVGERDQHLHHQPCPLVQPIVRRPYRRGERVPAGPAAVAPPLPAVDAAVARADPPLVGTGLRGAQALGRVRGRCSPGRVDWTRLPIAYPTRPVLVILAPLHTLVGLIPLVKSNVTISIHER